MKAPDYAERTQSWTNLQFIQKQSERRATDEAEFLKNIWRKNLTNLTTDWENLQVTSQLKFKWYFPSQRIDDNMFHIRTRIYEYVRKYSRKY